ncbi:Gfo/Idh/MocA family protein [Acuticoccus kandeliae]|uniref:Gfo/Idh/MocA family protein n=1 Tax=Acuticoccus kandeliae TaxID=2073160 RepID=UPI000D3ECF36|nr:Gfo/Idh/MocA family oxidoreductase [Acuticoccus kandeliae]
MKLGLVGIGAIARKQHLPVIAAHPAVELVAAASHQGTVDGIPNYPTLEAMLEAEPEVEAVTLCVPPAARYAAARTAIANGRHVFLEKPPGTTVAEITDLAAQAEAAGVTLFASWHSRYAAAVEPLRDALAGARIRSVHVPWREDVRVYHPGQRWIWEVGGFGVFDPGINAFSILTHALPRPFRLTRSVLSYPSNCAQPIAAELTFLNSEDVPITCDFSFDQPEPATWEIHVETDGPRYVLSGGGKRLTRDGSVLVDAPDAEYRALYDIFVDLVAKGASDVDLAPLMHVADAFLYAEQRTVGPFSE